MVSDDNRPADDDDGDGEYESKLSTRSHVHRLACSIRIESHAASVRVCV